MSESKPIFVPDESRRVQSGLWTIYIYHQDNVDEIIREYAIKGASLFYHDCQGECGDRAPDDILVMNY